MCERIPARGNPGHAGLETETINGGLRPREWCGEPRPFSARVVLIACGGPTTSAHSTESDVRACSYARTTPKFALLDESRALSTTFGGVQSGVEWSGVRTGHAVAEHHANQVRDKKARQHSACVAERERELWLAPTLFSKGAAPHSPGFQSAIWHLCAGDGQSAKPRGNPAK